MINFISNTDKKKTIIARTLRKKQTDAEKAMWFELRNRKFKNAKFRRQQAIGKFIVDFVSFEFMLVIELDGSQHLEETRKEYDLQRTQFLQGYRFQVVRFFNNDVLLNMKGVLEKLDILSSPQPSPNGRGRSRNFLTPSLSILEREQEGEV